MEYGAKAAKLEKQLDLEKMLLHAISDEYLARGEYDTAIKTFGEEKPFTSIIDSEVVHISWLKGLFEEYGFDIPEDISGEFLKTPESLSEALEIGVESEIENINMYESFLKNEIPEDVEKTFKKLRDASKGHLFVLRRRLESL